MRDALTPFEERELAAIDDALAERPVDAELVDVAELVRAVRAQRPAIDSGFANRLDERVAERFRRSSRAARLAALRPRRALLPALGAAASLLIALVVASSLLGNGSESEDSGQVAQSSRQLQRSVVAPPPGPGDDIAAGRPRRVERRASVVLSTSPKDVPDVADGVVRATDQVDGIVVTSSVSSGDGDRAGASFTLRVPTRRLDDALARLSKLAHVRSRTQDAQDVTGAFVSAQERLREALAERQALLRSLARADSANETASIRARLAIVRGEIAAGRAAVARLRQRTDFSTVAVSVESSGGSGAVGGDGDSWTPADAVRDALRILEVALGVVVVVGAALIPFGLLGLAAALAARTLRRRRREQALDAA